MSTLQDAQRYLQTRWGISSVSLNSVWWQLQRLQAKPKTGRCCDRQVSQEQQDRFKKTLAEA